jgi:DNA-binding response OmpR family regulator
VTERTVLIVEDDETLRRIVGRQLRARGFGITEAASAEEATAQLAAGFRPAVVLLDLNLPGDTGWDLLRSDTWKRAGSPPVLVASATTVDPRRLDEFGCAGYLPKPFAMATLVDTLERLIEGDSEGDRTEP